MTYTERTRRSGGIQAGAGAGAQGRAGGGIGI